MRSRGPGDLQGYFRLRYYLHGELVRADTGCVETTFAPVPSSWCRYVNSSSFHDPSTHSRSPIAKGPSWCRTRSVPGDDSTLCRVVLISVPLPGPRFWRVRSHRTLDFYRGREVLPVYTRVRSVIVAILCPRLCLTCKSLVVPYKLVSMLVLGKICVPLTQGLSVSMTGFQ